MGAARSVLDRDAGDFGALQRLADGFGLRALKSGKPGAVEFLVTPGDDRLGEGIGLAHHAARLFTGCVKPAAGLAFALQRADLDDPAGVAGDRFDRAGKG